MLREEEEGERAETHPVSIWPISDDDDDDDDANLYFIF